MTISGSATVARSAEIRDQLACAVAQGGELEVTIEATEIDVTAIQLLVSARRSMRERGGTLRLSHPPSGVLLDALVQGGFVHHGGEDTIWSPGAER